MIARIALAGMLLVVPGAHAAGSDGWNAWREGIARQCPGRHIEQMGDGTYDDFLGAFHQSLTTTERRRFDKLSAIEQHCANARIGFGCEMMRSLDAAQQLGLLDKMVAFGCRTVQCEEAASCSLAVEQSGYENPRRY